MINLPPEFFFTSEGLPVKLALRSMDLIEPNKSYDHFHFILNDDLLRPYIMTLPTEEVKTKLRSYEDLCFKPLVDIEPGQTSILGELSVPIMLAKGLKESFSSYNLNYDEGFLPTESELYTMLSRHIKLIKHLILGTFKYTLNEVRAPLNIEVSPVFKIHLKDKADKTDIIPADAVFISGELRITKRNCVPSKEDFLQICDILVQKVKPLDQK